MLMSRLARLAVPLVVLGATLLLTSAPAPVFTAHDKAYYADASAVNFVRPGLVLKIVGAATLRRQLIGSGTPPNQSRLLADLT
jgi:hypothetical protein